MDWRHVTMRTLYYGEWLVWAVDGMGIETLCSGEHNEIQHI